MERRRIDTDERDLRLRKENNVKFFQKKAKIILDKTLILCYNEITMKKADFDFTKIYIRRVELGFTLKDVAQMCNRCTATVSKWENGKIIPNPKSIHVLAKALKVSPAFFFGLSTNGLKRPKRRKEQ